MTLKATQTFHDTGPVSHAEAIYQFTQALHAFGLEPNGALVADGQIHRVRTAGERNGKQSGWYRFYPDAPFAGSYGSHKLGEVKTWSGGRASAFTDTERAAQAQRCRQRKAEQEQTQDMAKARAIRLWKRA